MNLTDHIDQSRMQVQLSDRSNGTKTLPFLQSFFPVFLLPTHQRHHHLLHLLYTMPCMSWPFLTLVQEKILTTSHEVFISFRGEDTRQGFVSHLQSALRRNGIRTYMDDFDLERGNEISSTLIQAIEQSKISLIIFSENFASSRWTLDELVTIMSCKRTRGQIVLPIFYRISPSEVRKKRSYSAVFKKHQNLSRSGMKETEQLWTTAMAEAADLAGWESSAYRTESELVEVIAMEVMRKLESMSHGRSEGLSSQPVSGGSCHDDDPTPENSAPRKCLLLNGTLNLVGYVGDKIRDVFFRKENEKLILTTSWNSGQPLTLDTSGYFYRNPYVAKREQLWWGIQHSTTQAQPLQSSTNQIHS